MQTEYVRRTHCLSSARYKLALTDKEERQLAAALLREARHMIRRTSEKPRTRRMVELAMAWAVTEAEENDDSQMFKVYDRLAHAIEIQLEPGT